MKNLITHLILINLLLVSCEQSYLEQKLKSSNSFWYIFATDDNTIFFNINYGYVFLSNGELDYKGFDFSTQTLKPFRMNDVKPVMRWDYDPKKNLLKIENKTYNILKLEQDTLILQYYGDNKKRILINLRDKNPEILKSIVLGGEIKTR